jgi:hypothetical protein
MRGEAGSQQRRRTRLFAYAHLECAHAAH